VGKITDDEGTQLLPRYYKDRLTSVFAVRCSLFLTFSSSFDAGEDFTRSWATLRCAARVFNPRSAKALVSK